MTIQYMVGIGYVVIDSDRDRKYGRYPKLPSAERRVRQIETSRLATRKSRGLPPRKET